MRKLYNHFEGIATFKNKIPGRGLEPPCLAALAPKASASAISPSRQTS